jgi:hypothetical protein
VAEASRDLRLAGAGVELLPLDFIRGNSFNLFCRLLHLLLKIK